MKIKKFLLASFAAVSLIGTVHADAETRNTATILASLDPFIKNCSDGALVGSSIPIKFLRSIREWADREISEAERQVGIMISENASLWCAEIRPFVLDYVLKLNTIDAAWHTPWGQQFHKK